VRGTTGEHYVDGMKLILIIIVVVLVVLFLAGFLRRGR
jgi:flagellar basal body-associated protein FliL